MIAGGPRVPAVLALSVAVVSSLAAAGAHGQEAPGWGGALMATNDLRDRGVSLSGRDPAVAGVLYLDRADGLHAAATLRRIDDPRGNDAMASLRLGWSGIVGAYDWSVDLAGHLLVGEDAFFYPEVSAELSRDLGLVVFSAGTTIAPEGRWLVPGRATLDLHGTVEWPVPQAPWLAVLVEGGREFQHAADDNDYWRFGLLAGWRSFTVSLAYEGSSLALRRARDGVVLRLDWDF